MVVAGSFCIDEYEASLVRVPDGSAWSPFDNPGTTPVRAVSVANAVPQAYIDRNQAADACANAGKRLCTDSEWLRACRGPSGTTYPYGNTRQPGACNEQRAVHPAIEYFGTTDPVIYSMLSNSCLDQLPRSVDRTGALTGCVTTEGAFDLMGNLLEWTADPSGTLRGGSYEDTVLNGMGCSYVTTAHSELYSDYSTGFRCCADSLL
jgi:formylglycine-generating enzyme required for sulfatase activity